MTSARSSYISQISEIRVYGDLQTAKPVETQRVAVASSDSNMGAGALVAIVSMCVVLCVAAAFLGLIVVNVWFFNMSD